MLRSTVPFLLAYFSSGLLSLAQATSITVVNSDNDGDGSFREALELVDPDGEINFDASLNGENIIMEGAAFTLSKNVTIDASSLSNGITIDGNSLAENNDNEDDETQGRIFEIGEQATVSLIGLTLIKGGTENGAVGGPSLLQGDGDDAASGGAIYNSGNLTLTRCILSDNFTGVGGNGSTGQGGDGGSGAAIYNAGQLTLIECTLSDNQTGNGGNGAPGEGGFGFGGQAGRGGSGGAIANRSGATLVIRSCTFNGNQTGNGGTGGDGVGFSGYGGRGGHGGNGGALTNAGNLTLTNCTFAGNITGDGGQGGAAVFNDPGTGGSGGSGGAIQHSANTFTMIHCTISENQVGEGALGGVQDEETTPSGDTGGLGLGGGIFASELLSITNSIVSNNLDPAEDDLVGEVENPTNNILNSDLSIQLQALGDYGGVTSTMPPLSSSPAIGAADSNDSEEYDQRGMLRSVDSTGSRNPAAELGAVEFLTIDTTEYDELFDNDSDGDGLSDGDELIRGTDPLVADNPGTSNFRLSSLDRATMFPTFSFDYHDSHVQLRITRSTDLTNFTTIAESAGDFLATTNGLTQFTDEDPPEGGKAFYRLEILSPE